MGSRFQWTIKPRTLAMFVLLILSLSSTARAIQHPLDVISQLRGFHAHSFTQAIPTRDDRSIVIYRRLSTAEADATAKASEVGASVRDAIKKLRGGTDKFYHDLITAAKITLCEQDLEANKIRFVNCDDDKAYVDDNGNSVKVTVSELTDEETVNNYNAGLCEIKTNCYWADIAKEDTNRAKVYADPDSTMDSNAATAKIKEWATGLLGFVIPGIVLGVLSLLTMVFFLICRCCCNRCGGRFPREEGYTCMQKFLPLLFFLLFAIGVVVVSAVAFLYRGTMLTAVDDTFNGTIGTLENGSDWIVTVRTPLEAIGATVTSSAAKVKVKLDGTEFIDKGLTGITSSLNAIESDCTDRHIPKGCTVDTTKSQKNVDKDGNVCVPCTECNDIGKKAGVASDEISSKAGPGVEQLGTVKAQLNTKLVEISGQVQSGVDTSVTTANDLTATINDTRDKVDDVDNKFQSYRDQIGYAVMGLFALALVVIAIGLIGILFGLTPLKSLANIMHVAYFLGFIALILTFIISAIMLAIGVMLGDACEITVIFAENWTVPLGESAKAVDACFQNDSLLNVFNLTDKLSFARGGVKFPDLDMNSMFDFTDLKAFATKANEVDESAFAFDEAEFTKLLNNFNTYAQQDQTQTCKPDNVYTAGNLLTPWVDNPGPPAHSPDSQTALEFITNFYLTRWDSACTGGGGSAGKAFACVDKSGVCTFSKFMGEQFKVLFDMATVKKGIADFVAELQKNANGVTTATTTFETDTRNLNTGINEIKSDLDSSLIEYVDDFESAMYCSFIASGFWTIYDALCGDLMPAFTMIALMLFLCGLFLIAVNVCLIIGVKRLKAYGNGHIMDKEMKFK